MNVDSNGNKLSQKLIPKKVQSANIRQRRMVSSATKDMKFCNECGFRLRANGHEQGRHHKKAVR